MRPFCIATIGAILGIIIGLYLNSIVLFVVLVLGLIVILIKKFSKKAIIIFLIFSCIFTIYTNYLENKYSDINSKYKDKKTTFEAIVISDKQSKEYKDVYEVQIIKSEKFKMILNIKHSGEPILLEYGDKIKFTASYEMPATSRNYGGFSYMQYLKTKGIAGTASIKPYQVEVIGKNGIFVVNKIIHDIKKVAISKIKEILPENTANLCTGIALGEISDLSEEIKEDFTKSNLLHMLAISGANISYMLGGIIVVIERLKIHKRWSKVFLIIFLIFFMELVGFSSSVARACIMAIFQLLAGLLFRKSDIYQNLAISSLIILAINPYLLLDIGFQLSFGGTMGIMLFSKKLLNKDKLEDTVIRKVIFSIKEICMVTLSANLLIIPIMMLHFNTVSLTFLISNIVASQIVEISLMMSMVLIISVFIFKPIAILISIFLNPLLQFILILAKFFGNLPFSQILVPTPKIWQIILYYLLLYIIFFKATNILKQFNITKYKKVIFSIVIFLIISPYILKIFPDNKLTINFIDVGQGDSMLIETPSKKKILIDGGGSEFGTFDVGEKTLLPYLLDKGIMKIDYLLFSHFDSDHCKRTFYYYAKFESGCCGYR